MECCILTEVAILRSICVELLQLIAHELNLIDPDWVLSDGENGLEFIPYDDNDCNPDYVPSDEGKRSVYNAFTWKQIEDRNFTILKRALAPSRDNEARWC